MKYSYKARTQEGEMQVGNVEASSKDNALAILLGHGLFVLSLEPLVEKQWYDPVLDFFKRVKQQDLMIFTRQFATLLEAQVPLADSLSNLYKQTTHPMLKEVIYEIANDVDSGFSLSQALEKHKSVFSDFYINMTKSAEVTGRLSETLGFLADYLERQAIMMGKVKNALSYPVFIIVLFVVVVIVMVIVVFPKLTAIFEESSAQLPALTKFLISFSNFLSNWWWSLLIIFGAFIVVLLNYFRTNEGAAVKDELKLKIPIFGKIFQKLYISRFAEGARVLIKGGLTIPQAVEISSRTIGNVVYYEVLRRAAEDIRRGKLLSQALAERPEFPPLVSQLISVGESTGRMEELLEKINNFYSREVDDAVNNIVSLIQPALMVVIGGMIALLFAAILLPLYSITQTF